MRPGNRWNGEAASPITAAIYCALVALVVSLLLSYLFGRLGLGVVSADYAWNSPRALHLAGLNVYASQHVPLIGYGVPPGDASPIRASVTFPLTLWAILPFFSLVLGGYLSGRTRLALGRWAMVVPAVFGGLLYTAAMVGIAQFVSVKFVSAALPAMGGVEFNVPAIPFRPLASAVPLGCGVFAVISTYLGAILAFRFSPEHSIAGKWWSCAKAVFISGLIIQILVAGAGLGLFTRAEPVEEGAHIEFIQILPTVAGIGYALLHGSVLSYGAVPTAMPASGYSGSVQIYRGTYTKRMDETRRTRLGPYVWIGAALAAFVAFFAGRLAVKLGSRDGSLPTAVRIVIMQTIYMILTMWLCGLEWGIEGQFRAYGWLGYDPAMLIAALGVFVFALLGAHMANRRYIGRLVGYPSA